MKSGTTSLHSYLGKHPEIFMCDLKEPWYFVQEKNWPKGEKWYLSLFNGAGGAKLIGESSTYYTRIYKYLGVPQRILKFNPDALFIYIMRDPIERTISHYWQNVRWHNERRNMIDAIKMDVHYLEVSNYALQLSPYLKLFGEESIYTLTFEEMVSNPIKSIAKIFSWLGVDSSFIPENLNKKENATPSVVEQPREFGLLNKFRYSSIWNNIHLYFPKAFKKAARNIALKKIDRRKRSTYEVIEHLRPIQLKQVKILRKLLRREFPEWTSLYG